jgi:hypothetical protein
MKVIMEQRTEIFSPQFKLSTKIEEVDLNWLESDTTCYFYSPCTKLKKGRAKKIKIIREVKSEEVKIHHSSKCDNPDKSLIPC